MGHTSLADRQRSVPSEIIFGGELRDTEQAIQLWNRRASEFGRPPPALAFDVSQLAKESHRFFICADLLVREDSVLILYGATFARLLGLPERPAMDMSLLSQIPARYQPLFIKGCDQAIQEAMPVRFSGAIAHGGDMELYRASFMPLRMQSETLQLIYGSFNYRCVRDVLVRDRSVGISGRHVGLRQQVE